MPDVTEATAPAGPPGVSSQEAADEAGITLRQLGCWFRTGLLHPVTGRQPGRGRGGVYHRWPPEEVRVARLMGRLTAAGIGPALAAVIARKWPGVHEIAPGVWIQVGPAAGPRTDAGDAGGKWEPWRETDPDAPGRSWI